MNQCINLLEIYIMSKLSWNKVSLYISNLVKYKDTNVNVIANYVIVFWTYFKILGTIVAKPTWKN